MGGATPSYSLAAIRQYYVETYVDYRSLWLNRENLAFHFGCYDEPQLSHSQSLERSNAMLADIAAVCESDEVLDAGCGLGGSACWVARERGASATGIALGPAQMQKATRLAHDKGLGGKVRFLCADFTRTPFPAETFDVVWAQESMCHAADKAAFYREAWRVLRPGGRLVLADFMRTRRGEADADARLLREWLSGWAVPDIATASEHVDLAGAAGFADVRVREVTERMKPSLRRLHRWSLIVWAPEHLLYHLGIRTPIQHGNVIAARRQWQALLRQLWVYGIVSAVKE